MRELRFRFWDKDENKMRYSGDSHCPDLTANGCPVQYMTRKNQSMRYDALRLLRNGTSFNLHPVKIN